VWLALLWTRPTILDGALFLIAMGSSQNDITVLGGSPLEYMNLKGNRSFKWFRKQHFLKNLYTFSYYGMDGVCEINLNELVFAQKVNSLLKVYKTLFAQLLGNSSLWGGKSWIKQIICFALLFVQFCSD
jgi:hypothetical protein